jgi:hypothetical protein
MEDWTVDFEKTPVIIMGNPPLNMFSPEKWQRRQLNSGSSEQLKSIEGLAKT